MTPLLTAITTAFRNNATLTAGFTGGLWLIQAPERTPMPYLIMSTDDAPLTSVYGGRRWSDTPVIFAAYHTDPDVLQTLFAAMLAAFDDAILPMPVGQMNDARRVDDPQPDLMPDVDGNGNAVYRLRCTFEYSVG